MTQLHVVMGPPCAGKSTHVTAHRALADVVIDMDTLAEAFGGAGPRTALGAHRTAALTARRAVLDRVQQGRWDSDGDVWLIHHHPTAQAMARYLSMHAHLVLLDPGQGVCLARARADKRPRWTLASIAEWYADPIHLDQSHLTHSDKQPSRAW